MTTFTTKKSGYLTAATAVTFSGTQTLVSLMDNEWTDLSDEIDNSTNKYDRVDLYLDLASAAFTGSDSAIEIYLVPCVDGTNYPTWTGNTTSDAPENAFFWVGTIPLKAATQAQDGVLIGVELPNGKYKWGARNRGNVTLASSGNTLYWRPHTLVGTDA